MTGTVKSPPASALATRRVATQRVGTELPHGDPIATPLVERAFAFVDLCGFTSFLAERGVHDAQRELRTFREQTREIATRRGVMIGKWLGDGAMIVGTAISPMIATAIELTARYQHQPMALRAGVAHGDTLLFDGDDYVGQPANLAARLCQAARPGEVLARGYPMASMPAWVAIVRTRDVTLRGLGRFRRVQSLAADAELDLGILDLSPSSARPLSAVSPTPLPS